MKPSFPFRFGFLLLLGLFCNEIRSQVYVVEKLELNSDRYDDYSPVYYRDGLVFTSTRKHDMMVVHSSPDNSGSANLWFSHLTDTLGAEAGIFSKELLTGFHDGPATFSADGSVIYYSRNLEVDSKLRDVFDEKNQLGLYRAEWKDGKWTGVTPFPYNSPDYSITTPALSADGSRIYFTSDMPGGFGGADLYYCDLVDGEWQPPVNLGSKINTTGNESYPFENGSGILYFASDGWIGLGNKDIYYTSKIDGEWIIPIHMDADINSKADDFGLITDLNGKEGYFSSNRGKNDDIFRYVTDIPSFLNCDSLQKNYYCFLFYDEGFLDVDTLSLSYEWSFGDGTRVSGIEAEHCFPGPDNYTVQLNIIDNNTGNTFFTQASYEVEIRDVVQPYISSADAALKEEEIGFSGLKTNLPEMEITEYYWDFGDGTRIKGEEAFHTYKEKGSYRVQLGVTGRADSSGLVPKECVFKQIEILEDNQDLAIYRARETGELQEMPESINEDPSMVSQLYSMKEAEENNAVYRVEVLNSDSRISIDSSVFDPLRGIYDITEVFLREESLYSYTVGEASTVMETYSVYKDVVARGYENANVKSYVLADLAGEELLQLTASLAGFKDAYFEFNDYRIGEASYPILDRVVEIMNKYPGIGLEIAAHTDNMGSFEYNMNLSQRRAQSMVDYLVTRGIERNRLIGKGYGESRPIAPNNSDEGRSMNRRVEFIILNEPE